jgi:NAD(P)-dependent dehydrogenase (short-subunit alcohol dehydrogenase family)
MRYSCLFSHSMYSALPTYLHNRCNNNYVVLHLGTSIFTADSQNRDVNDVCRGTARKTGITRGLICDESTTLTLNTHITRGAHRLNSKMLASLHLLYDSLVSCLAIFIGSLLPRIRVDPVDLTGKVAIVTGANSGIGYALALALAKQNATVYLACRNTSKAQKAANEIIDAYGNSGSVHVVSLDTSSLASVRSFAATWGSRPIDILAHNAGISGPSDDQHTTPEGLGVIYATNFAGSFLLTSLLEPHLSPTARIVFTSSTGQYAASPRQIFTLPRLAPDTSPSAKKLTDSQFYADTKFMQVAFAALLQRRFDKSSTRRTAHAFSPGYTYTPIFDKIPGLPWYVDPGFWVLKACTRLCIPVEQGAATGLWLATTDDAHVVGVGKGGQYWDRCVKRSTMVDVLPKGMLERMWQLWEVDTGAKWE